MNHRPNSKFAKKIGLLAVFQVFGKKSAALIIAGIVAAFGAAKRMMTGRG